MRKERKPLKEGKKGYNPPPEADPPEPKHPYPEPPKGHEKPEPRGASSERGQRDEE